MSQCRRENARLSTEPNEKGDNQVAHWHCCGNACIQCPEHRLMTAPETISSGLEVGTLATWSLISTKRFLYGYRGNTIGLDSDSHSDRIMLES